MYYPYQEVCKENIGTNNTLLKSSNSEERLAYYSPLEKVYVVGKWSTDKKKAAVRFPN